LNYIEATCEDAARAYFKTLIKKREVDVRKFQEFEKLKSPS